VLLRLQDFDSGELRINGSDISTLDPAEYHSHVTMVLQNFVRYEASVRDNIGVGCVSDIRSRTAVERAMTLGGAEKLTRALPRGLYTQLDSSGAAFGLPPPLPMPTMPGMSQDDRHVRHGLSGGEVRGCVSFLIVREI
jgi:ABC-type multidrug transport system fused ATPase/permease subunit